MKTVFSLAMLFISAFLTCQAQVEYLGSESLEGMRPSEIRQLFLSSTPGTEVSAMAVRSRQAHHSSIISYIVGGLFAAGGIYGLVELNSATTRGNLGRRIGVTIATTLSFSISGAATITGILQTRKSNAYVDEAISIYRRK